MPRARLLDMECRVCGRRDVEEVLDLGDQPHCNSLLTPEQLGEPEPVYPLRLGFCRACTASQIDFTVPKETMFSDYLYVSGTTKSLRDHFRRTSEKLIGSMVPECPPSRRAGLDADIIEQCAVS